MGETSDLLNLSAGIRESGEDGSDISSILHGNDSELVLLVDPDEERFCGVVEDASALGPVTVKSTSLKEAITLLEQEVVSNELVSLLVGHGAKRVEGSSELTVKRIAGFNDLLFDSVSLFSCDSWSKRELCQVTTNSDTGGYDH